MNIESLSNSLQQIIPQVIQLRVLVEMHEQYSKKMTAEHLATLGFNKMYGFIEQFNKHQRKMNRLGNKFAKAYESLSDEDRAYLIEHYGCKDIL